MHVEPQKNIFTKLYFWNHSTHLINVWY